jgi:(p)ppGpp synthase/HD superfamily hydrolase
MSDVLSLDRMTREQLDFAQVVMTDPQMHMAFHIADLAHKDQVDKQGAAYIEHPFRVAASLRNRHHQMAALLHDVIEDTDFTAEDLVAHGIPEFVVQWVEVLSRRPGETYVEFIERIAEDKATATIKVGDLLDNLDPDRGDGSFVMSDGHRKRYLRALKRLMPVVAS